MSKEVPPVAVMTFLNQLFSIFDALVDKHCVQKVSGTVLTSNLLWLQQPMGPEVAMHGSLTVNAWWIILSCNACACITECISRSYVADSVHAADALFMLPYICVCVTVKHIPQQHCDKYIQKYMYT